jgi:hypothetical protein
MLPAYCKESAGWMQNDDVGSPGKFANYFMNIALDVP